MEAVTIDTIKQEYLDRLKRNLIYQGTTGFSKIESAIKNIIELEKLLTRYDGTVISEKYYILKLKFNEHIFFYSPITRKLRLHKTQTWRTDVITFLEEVINNKKPKTVPIPKLTFGKYKGESLQDVMEKDPNYIKWCKESGINLNKRCV
jgi:hypothetical protein